MTSRTRRSFITTAIAGFAILPAATAIGATTGGRTHVVEIHKHKYMPENLTIQAGDRVRFINHDFAPHTVTSDDGKFDSGYLLLNGSIRMTFTNTGAYPYFCEVHEKMHGRISVV